MSDNRIYFAHKIVFVFLGFVLICALLFIGLNTKILINVSHNVKVCGR